MYIVLAEVNCVEFRGIPDADYQSPWLPIRAYDPSSRQVFHHGFRELPILVDVQVKSRDDPNEDFIFQAIGNANQGFPHRCVLRCIQETTQLCHALGMT